MCPLTKGLRALPLRQIASYRRHVIPSLSHTSQEIWADARRQLVGLAGGGLNIAHETVTRHASDPAAASIEALRFVGRDGSVRSLTYGELERASNRFARAIGDLGIGHGDRVFTALGRVPELYVTALGTWKAGAVFCPMFAAFGPEPLRQRMDIGQAALLVTNSAIYQRRVEMQRETLTSLRYVLCIDGQPSGTLAFAASCEAASDEPIMAPTGAEDPAILHFTSGTTGTPKGAMHVHDAVAAHRATASVALGLRRGDVFWCTADPGWVTGTSYGIIAPLALGVTVVVDEAEFDAQRWNMLLEREGITVWYTAPTAIRLMMRAPTETPARALPALRFIASVGEPLAADAVQWGVEAFGQPIHDNWWQTETGVIMVANQPGETIKPGSMGRPLPGVELGILAVDEEGQPLTDAAGRVHEVATAGETGMLALRPGWPSQFRDYLGQPKRYAACFRLDPDNRAWYVSGDLASCDEDGHIWFVGRADDVIKSSGHLIGPFEVEHVLLEHPAVAAAAVFGKPDPVAGAIVKAVVVLRGDATQSDDMRRELLGHARRRLGPAVAPREIDFVQHLPQTRSGKILRRLLRARELGLPEGDLSTLEPAPQSAPAPDSLAGRPS